MSLLVVIYGMSIIMFIILIKWILHSLSELNNNEKIMYIISGILIVSLISLIIFNFSKSSIDYPNEQVENEIEKMLLLIFIPLNGLIFLPYVAKILDRLKSNEIESDEIKKKILIILIILVVLIIFECKYLKKSQLGILAFYHS